MYCYSFIVEDTAPEQPKGKDAQDKVHLAGSGTEFPCPLWVPHPPTTSEFTNPGAL